MFYSSFVLLLLFYYLEPGLCQGNGNGNGYVVRTDSRNDNPYLVSGTAAPKSSEICFVGAEVADENLNNRNGAYLLLCPSLVAQCDGSVREWIFQSGADDNTPAYLGFWRRATNGSLQLVGFNRVRGSQLGRHSSQIREGNRVNVLKNDFIGVFYDQILTDYSVVSYQQYAKTFQAAKSKKLQACYATNFTYGDIMRLHGRIEGFDELDVEPTLISLQAVVDRHPLYSCYAGSDPKVFSSMRSPTWLALMPAASFPCAGRIIRWELLSVAAALQPISVYLSVWRFATNTSWKSPRNKRVILQRVSYHQVLVDRNGFMTLEGDDLFDIYVQYGDFLGIYFDAPSADSGVPIMTDMNTLPDFTDAPEVMTTPSILDATEALFPDVVIPENTTSTSTTTEIPTTTTAFPLERFLRASGLDPSADPSPGPGISVVSPKPVAEMDWCILSKTYREKIDNAMDIGTLTLTDFRIRKCSAAIRAFVKDFTLTNCGMPPNVDNSRQYGNTTFETSVISYECHEGYILVGDPSVVCQSNGLWTSPPDCVESFEKSGVSPCYFPPPVDHADSKLNTYRTPVSRVPTNTTTSAYEPILESVFVTYTCKTGYLMVGKPEVECKPPGSWGELPRCAEIVAACRAGKVVQAGGVSEKPMLMAFTKLRFTCSGEIHTWEFYSNSSEGEVVHFDVWRKVDNGQYRLVGSNPFPALSKGRVIQPVEVNDRIRVAAGDFIGLHYVTTKVTPVIPIFNTRTAGELARLLSDTWMLDMNDATLIAQTSAANGYLDLKKLATSSLRLPPVIAYTHALPGCGLPNEVAHAKYLAKETVQGSVASYECNKGYALHGGKDVFCRSPNMWTNPPVCLPVELCRTGPQLYNESLANKASFLNIFKQMNFPCAGVISEWTFYSLTNSGVVYFGVWRYITNRAFELVGVNRVVVNGTGLQTYYVKGDERITVLQDYLVGIHYDDPLIQQDAVVVPHADQTRPKPYRFADLYDGWSFDYGHDDIVRMNGKIELEEKTAGLRKLWRIPAVNPVVRRALVSCGNPPPVPNSAILGRETTQYAIRTYRCDSGYFLVGNENVTCHVSGRWSPPPLCVTGCIWGKAIPDKEFNTRSQKNVLSIFVSKPLKCRGFIKTWNFFSIVEQPASFYVDVWRRNGTQQMYLLIGSNRIHSNGYGLQKAEIGVDQQIFVEAGDVIGFHYDIMTPPIVAEAEPDDHAYHPNDMYDVLEEMDYGLITPGTTFLLAPIKIRKAAKLPSLSVTVLNYQSHPYGLCEPDTFCPQNAECVPRDRYSVCMCSSGFWLRYDGSACLPAAGIGEPCDESVACESQVMTCTEAGVCDCIPGWTPSADGQRCKPVSPNPEFRYSVHGEACGSEALCYHSFRDQECRDGVCQCRRGFRWASDFEKRANPETLEECRPVNISTGLLPELAELCYIDQRAYFERTRRSQQNYALAPADISLKMEKIKGGDGEKMGISNFQEDHQGDIIRTAVISALSMFGACAVMFAVWSWNSQQGIYPIERGIGNRIGNLFSASRQESNESGSAFTSMRRSMQRNMFQRFYNNVSIYTTATDEDTGDRVPFAGAHRGGQPVPSRNDILAATSLSQCSLNLNEVEDQPTSGLCVTNRSHNLSTSSGHTDFSLGHSDISGNTVIMKPFNGSSSSIAGIQDNSSLNNQFGAPTPRRLSQSDTLTLLSTSQLFLQNNPSASSTSSLHRASIESLADPSAATTVIVTAEQTIQPSSSSSSDKDAVEV